MKNKIYQLVQTGWEDEHQTWGFFENPMEAFDKLMTLDDKFPFFKEYTCAPWYDIIEHEMGFGGKNDKVLLSLMWEFRNSEWTPMKIDEIHFDSFMCFKTIDEQSRIRNFIKKFTKV